MRTLILASLLVACGRSHGVDDAGVDADGVGDAEAELDAAVADGAPLDAPDLEIPAPACTDSCRPNLVGVTGEEGRILEVVAERERRDFDAWIGRYTCGAEPVAVYAGSFDARDDRGDFMTAYDNGTIAGPVVATLEVQWPPPWNGYARLIMRSPNGRQLRLQHDPENPERGESSAVEPSDHTVPAHDTYCYGCLPFMADFPEAITVEPFEMDAVVGDWRVWGEGGRVERVAADAVTLEHVETLAGPNGDFDEYARSEDAWRRVRPGTVEELLDEVRDDFDVCYLVTDYEVGEAIAAECPSSHALGPLRILAQQTCCDREIFIEDCVCDIPFRTERECF